MNADKHQEQSSNQTAEKLLEIMEALSEEPEPIKLSQLAEKLRMNSSTLYRFLTALRKKGYAVKDEETDKYAMSLKLCRISEQIRRNTDIVDLLHGYIEAASALFGESAHLARREHEMIVYVDNVSVQSHMLSIHRNIGRSAPLYCTGIGKLFLSEYSKAQLDSLEKEKGLLKLTENTITDRGVLEEELKRIREQDYAYDNEECEIGLRCIAVPVRDFTGRIVAGISISGPVMRMTDENIVRRLPQLVSIGVRASHLLGFKGDLT